MEYEEENKNSESDYKTLKILVAIGILVIIVSAIVIAFTVSNREPVTIQKPQIVNDFEQRTIQTTTGNWTGSNVSGYHPTKINKSNIVFLN